MATDLVQIFRHMKGLADDQEAKAGYERVASEIESLREQLAACQRDAMSASNLINGIFAALRDEPYPGYGREKVMKMIRDWYAESDGE